MKETRCSKRTARLRAEWGVAFKKLGGLLACRGHPWCATIWHYYQCAPYSLPSREWAQFRKWMKERVDQARVFGG